MCKYCPDEVVLPVQRSYSLSKALINVCTARAWPAVAHVNHGFAVMRWYFRFLRARRQCQYVSEGGRGWQSALSHLDAAAPAAQAEIVHLCPRT